ncbi:aminotransferase class IV [Zobellia roscoffensis]|uniref:aminotransferase class IV n=1 Tax=Zobellia roscoffensis TaxID=2779508 RepID=UPI00188C995A|nr:aminotransferase class IV [Zobellia roscoffensis]
MINYNGNLLEENTQFLDHQNRGLRYGDALFETMRMVNGKLFFWEDHYLRLMASMRVLRMEIPMDFTMEFLESKISETVAANSLTDTQARIRFSVFREKGGLYLPATNDIGYCIETIPLQSPFYVLSDALYEVELFKDFYVNADMLSTLKTNNKIINVVGSIFAKENEYQNCLLLNSSKQVVEALNGNIFLVKNGVIKTPPLNEGCLNGIIRKKLIDILGKLDDYQFEEASISPFELQKADEIFITNSIVGIQPVTKYRKKEFGNTMAKGLLGKLNAAARLS